VVDRIGEISMKRKENGFAATGILYTILLVFLVLMTTLLATLSSRSRILEKLKKDAKDINEEKYGILSRDYTQGERVSYLGYEWLVMRDYGKSTRLMLSDHLSTNELQLYLPSNVPSSTVSNIGIPMCVEGTSYCPKSYRYNTSLIKTTVEKWLDSKMSENNLSKTTELEEMTFNDGVDSIKSYVRIPIEEEEGLTRSVISEEVTQVYNGTSYLVKYYKGCNYSPLLSDKSQDGDYIATLTKGKAGYDGYVIFPFTGNGYCDDGKSARYRLHASQVMPIITVKES
jgi:hypothetical protein